MNPPHHDNIPVPIQSADNILMRQTSFAATLHKTVGVLTKAGVPSDSIHVHAGGGVFLLQHHLTGASNRAPTDLDIIVPDFNRYREAVIAELEKPENEDFHLSTRFIEEERTHHGLRFPNPVFEIETTPEFQPVDIIGSEMRTIFPANHKYLPGKTLVHPVDTQTFTDLSIPSSFEGSQFKIAPPCSIAIYKLLYGREKAGKQDVDDLVRLGELGVFVDISQMAGVMKLFFENERELAGRIYRDLCKFNSKK